MTTLRVLETFVAASTTSSACDVLMKRGIRAFMRQRIRPLDSKSKMFGRARTIERRPSGLAPRGATRSGQAMLDAVESAEKGSVFVFNGHPGHEAALWGGLMATAAHMRGAAGIVADGPVRDPQEIVELGQHCFCTGSVSAGQAGILTLGDIDKPLHCGGVDVHPGDFIFGDCNGVIVIPQGIELEVMEEAAAVERADQEASRLLLSGISLGDVMKRLGRV